MFLFGIAAALLGATLPLLSERLEIGLGRVGTLFLVMNACMLASSFALGALQDRFGMKPPLVVGPLVVGAALLVVAGAETYAHLLLAVALLGVGGSALNGASNALVSDLHEDLAAKSAALNRVGLFFGFGALFIPFAIGLLLRAAGLRAILTGGRGPVRPRGGGERPARLPPGQAGGRPVARRGGPARPRPARPPARAPALLPVRQRVHRRGLHDDAPDERGRDERRRRLLRPGRLLGRAHADAGLAGPRALVPHGRAPRAGERRGLGGGDGPSRDGHAPYLAVAMVVVLGAALAGIFPAVLGVAGSRYPAHSGTVFGILFTMALSGGMTLPWLTGQAAAAWGLRPALGLVVLQFLAVLALQWLVTAGRARPASAGGR